MRIFPLEGQNSCETAREHRKRKYSPAVLCASALNNMPHDGVIWNIDKIRTRLKEKISIECSLFFGYKFFLCIISKIYNHGHSIQKNEVFQNILYEYCSLKFLVHNESFKEETFKRRNLSICKFYPLIWLKTSDSLF